MRWLDRTYLALSRRLGCFPGGFGDERLLAEAFDPEVRPPPEPPRIAWTRARVHGALRITEGELDSPEEALPLECSRARVCLLEPREGDTRGARAQPEGGGGAQRSSSRGEADAPALAVVLASWGDEGFAMRRRLLAPVVREGVACLLLENPFYGARRPVGQRGACLRTVSDFVAMGRAAVRESHALLAWARARGYGRSGVVGYSMGGQMAAMSAALAPWPVRVVAMAPAVTPASVFLDGPLRRDVAWDALGAGGEARLREVLTSLSVLALPAIAEPAWATLVGTRRDAIVPPEDALAIARHWRTSVRWLDDGHVSAIAFRGHALAQAVVDTFAR